MTSSDSHRHRDRLVALRWLPTPATAVLSSYPQIVRDATYRLPEGRSGGSPVHPRVLGPDHGEVMVNSPPVYGLDGV